MVDTAVAQGAKVVMGGAKHDIGELYYKPTLLTDITRDMEMFKEEIFGPVVSVIKFQTEEVSAFFGIIVQQKVRTASILLLIYPF